jgi:hypothetical protein
MITATLLLPLLAALAGPPQESVFESSEFGVRLKIPAGWNVDATRQPRVILKLKKAGDAAVPPELQVYELPFPQPITLGQYREQLRHFLQKAYRNPRMLDDREAKAGGRPGFVLQLASIGTAGETVVSHKGIFELSPSRMVGVDGVFPEGQAEALRGAYEEFLKSIEFIPRKRPAGVEAELERFGGAMGKLAAGPGLDPRTDVLEVMAGDKKIGEYTLALKPGETEGAAGVEVQADYAIDLGEEGRLETHLKGFLSNDLSVQKVAWSELRVAKDKRAQNFEASVTLAKGKLEASRRVNGEASTARLEAPERAVLSELLEALQVRLLGAGKDLLSVPVVSAFENDPGYAKIELRGLNSTKVDDKVVQIHVSFLVRETGSLATYWHDEAGRLLRITQQDKGLVFRRKK